MMKALSKIMQLPENVREEVDALLDDTTITYEEISAWLKEHGYDISKSSVGRYAIQINRAARRVSETILGIKAITDVLREDPESDYAKASRIIFLDKLIRRVWTADEEFQEMSLEKAGSLIASISRIGITEERMKHAMKSKAELAFCELEDEILKAIQSDRQIAAELHALLERAKEKVLADSAKE